MKAGIVGCGYVSGLHVNAWRDAGVKVVAACDLNRNTAQKFSKDWGIPDFYTSFSKMLAKNNLDTVSVCVPPTFHSAVATEALKFGCSVVVEKPFTVNTAEAEKLLDTLRSTSARLTVIHSQLFEPSMFNATKMVKKGEIGQVTGMDVGILHSPHESMAADKNHWCHKLPGGRFGENLPHPVYMLQAFLGKLKIRSVRAEKLGPHPWMTFDELRVILEDEENRFGTIRISFNAPGKDRTDVHVNIYGTGGTIHAGIYPVSSIVVSKPGRGILHLGNMAQQFRIWGTYLKNILRGKAPRYYSISHSRIIKSFVDSLSGNEKPLVTPENGYEAVKLVEQICNQIEKLRLFNEKAEPQ